MALAETARLVTQLSLKDDLTPGLQRARTALANADSAAAGFGKRASAGFAQAGKGAKELGAGLLRLGSYAALGVAGGFVAALKVTGDFEAQMNTINTIAFVSQDRLKAMGEGIRKTARDTGIGLSDLTSAYYDLLSAGVKVADAQKELDVAVRLGIGGLGTTAEAIDLLTTAQNSYGLSASDTAHAADLFAQAVADGKVKVSEIAGTFANVAPVAHTFGVKLEEITAAYGFLTAKGVPAAEVSTQMNRAILEVVKSGPKMTEVLKKLGISGADLIKQKGLVGALQAVRDESTKLGIPFQDLFGRIDGYKFALETTGDAQRDFNAELAKMGGAGGMAQKQFEERQKGFNFQLARLKAILIDVGITIGSKVLPVIVPLFQQLSDFISQNQDKIQAFGKNLADGIAGFVGRVKGGEFNSVIAGFKTLAAISKTILDVFLKLPGPVQAIAVAGIGLSRLPGGSQILGGLGNVAGGLLKIAFNRGSTPANPLFVSDVTGGLGKGGAPVGLGGKLFGGLVAAADVALIAGAMSQYFSTKEMIAPVKAGEQAQVQAVLDSKDMDRLLRGINTIDDQLNSSDIGTNLALFASDIPILGGALGDVHQTLNQQRAEMVAQLKAMGLTDEQIKTLMTQVRDNTRLGIPKTDQAAKDTKTENALIKAAREAQKTQPKRQPVKPPITAAEFEKILRTTPFIGSAQYKSIFERFSTAGQASRGKDPVGEGFLDLVKRLKDPKAPAVMFEIRGHLKELASLEAYYIAHGDTTNALKVQGVINEVDKLIGITQLDHKASDAAKKAQTDATRAQIASSARIPPELRSNAKVVDTAVHASAAQTAAHLRTLASVARRTGDNTAAALPPLHAIQNKKTSVSVTANVSVAAAFSVTALGNQLTHISETVSRQYAGKVVPISG